MFREFNEADRLFKHRTNGSIVQASNYLKQVPSPISTIIATFIPIVSGGFTAVLRIIAFLKNLCWKAIYLVATYSGMLRTTVFGTVTTVIRAAI
ncbi:autophagy-related protein 9-like [Primulina tabacum]|uniref:autophagy-related protein 9-like n=1 Tax=Primulina tabacum TaxID=48773 RepID=UPI003F59F763